MTKDKLKQEIVMLNQELKDYSDLFDLQQTRMKAAVAMWQAATGSARLPDLGDLLEWFLKNCTQNKRVLEIVDACFHRYASSYRNDAKKYAMELMNSKPNTSREAR